MLQKYYRIKYENTKNGLLIRLRVEVEVACDVTQVSNSEVKGTKLHTKNSRVGREEKNFETPF